MEGIKRLLRCYFYNIEHIRVMCGQDWAGQGYVGAGGAELGRQQTWPIGLWEMGGEIVSESLRMSRYGSGVRTIIIT